MFTTMRGEILEHQRRFRALPLMASFSRVPVILCAALCSTTLGCATIKQNGFRLHQGDTVRSLGTVQALAASDFSCPKERIELTIISETWPPATHTVHYGIAQQIAVTARDKQAL